MKLVVSPQLTLVRLLVLLAAGSFLAGCGRGRAPRNLLLVTLDTTRVDGLSCYGQTRVETPHLDRIAREGVRFDRAYSCSPVTLPSHASILTGTYPIYHGARDNGTYHLESANVTLAEILKDQGFDTAAFLGAFPLDSRYGVDQGFDVYDDDFSQGTRYAAYTYPERSAEAVADSFLGWADGWDGDRFFAWLHFFDPHAPNNPPPEFARRFSDLYLAEIAAVDAQIGRILAALDDRGVLKDTLVVVVADHGEGLKNPHAEPAHGVFLYDETIRVPFLMRHPASLPEKVVIDDIVGTVDLVPTVLSVLSLNSADDVQGVDLLGLIRGETPADPERILYMETLLPYDQYGWSPLCGVRSKSWKYIRAPQPELYRIDEDREEQNDVAGSMPDQRKKMERLLEETGKRFSRERPAGFGRMRADLESTRALEALGYVQGSNPALIPGDRESDPLELIESIGKDPKDFIQAYILMEDGRRLDLEKDDEGARRLYERARSIDPENREVIASLASLEFRIGNFKASEQLFRRMLEVAPESSVATYGIAFSLESRSKESRKNGDNATADANIREAEQYYLRTLAIDPFHCNSRINLGVRYLLERRLDDARKQFLQVLDVEPTNEKGMRNLAAVYVTEKRDPEAERVLVRLLKQNPNDAVAGYHLAGCLERMGEFDRAIALYERLHEVHPRDRDVKAALDRVRRKKRGDS